MTTPIFPVQPSPAVAMPTPADHTGSVLAGGAMGKNEFLKLLVAQMTHQDPLNPLDGQEMASQLAQFSSVEQLINIGAKLDAQASSDVALLSAVNSSAALALLGRTVMVQTDVLTIGADGASAPPRASVDVPGAGGTLTLRITDAAGNTVQTVPLGFRDGGVAEIDLSEATAHLEPGTYRIAVDCTSGGNTVPLATRLAMRVDGVRFGQDQTYITSGGTTIPISLIASVTAPE